MLVVGPSEWYIGGKSRAYFRFSDPTPSALVPNLQIGNVLVFESLIRSFDLAQQRQSF